MINQKGQTLIEALVSLSIAVAVISAITVVVLSSLNNATFTRNQNQATQYAQEGLEITKRIALSHTGEFASTEGVYCLDENKTILDTPLYNPGSGRCGFNISTGAVKNIKDTFSREIQIEHDSPECDGSRKIIVRVQWSDNKCENTSGPFCHQVELSSCLSGYNPSKSGTNPI